MNNNMPSPLNGLAVINFVAQADYRKLLDMVEATNGRVLELDGRLIDNKASLLRSLTEKLGPDSPPLTGWDALRDTIRTLVGPGEFVALVWTYVHHMLDGSLADLITAADILMDVSRQTYPHSVFVTMMMGEGPNFCPLALTLPDKK
jgi:hypothetical protein